MQPDCSIHTGVSLNLSDLAYVLQHLHPKTASAVRAASPPAEANHCILYIVYYILYYIIVYYIILFYSILFFIILYYLLLYYMKI